jgi:hypothetical protein
MSHEPFRVSIAPAMPCPIRFFRSPCIMADEAAPVYLDVLDARAVVAEAYRGLCMPAGRDPKGDHGPAGRAVIGRYPERAALAVVEVFGELHIHVVAAPAHRAA